MTAGPWLFTDTARVKLFNGTFKLADDVFKVALFKSTSNIGPGSTTYAGLTDEVAASNGYSTGGVVVEFAFTGTTTADVKFVTNPTWAATGGNIVNIRWAVLYKVGGDVIAYCRPDNTPADVTVSAGSLFQIDADGTPEPVFDVT